MTGPASVRTAASSTLCDEVNVSAVGTQAATVRSALDDVTHQLTTNRYPSCGPRHPNGIRVRLRLMGYIEGFCVPTRARPPAGGTTGGFVPFNRLAATAGHRRSAMSAFIHNVTFDASDPRLLGRFWSQVTGYA